jgi:hypothetical protein
MARVSSCHGKVVTGESRGPTPSLLGERRPEPMPPLEAMWNYSVVSSVMAHHVVSGPLRVEALKAVPESLLLGERLRPPK